MSLVAPALAFVAGVLTILSPCVLPLAPVLAGSAMAQHRLGPAALALGLALSFSLVGLFVATLGFAIGLDSDALRSAGAVVMLAIGVVLATPQFEGAIAAAASPLASWAGNRTASFAPSGLAGQAGLGALLGVVWSPCVGPTLGAATVLAAQGENLPAVGFIMAMFGLGAASTLAGIGYGARAIIARHRGALQSLGKSGKHVLGWTLVAIALLVLSGLDRLLEAALVELSPQWLTELTTRF